MIELADITQPQKRTELISHLEALKADYTMNLAKGLPPAEFKQSQAWIKAVDSALKIVKSPKSLVFNP